MNEFWQRLTAEYRYYYDAEVIIQTEEMALVLVDAEGSMDLVLLRNEGGTISFNKLQQAMAQQLQQHDDRFETIVALLRTTAKELAH